MVGYDLREHGLAGKEEDGTGRGCDRGDYVL